MGSAESGTEGQFNNLNVTVDKSRLSKEPGCCCSRVDLANSWTRLHREKTTDDLVLIFSNDTSTPVLPLLKFPTVHFQTIDKYMWHRQSGSVAYLIVLSQLQHSRCVLASEFALTPAQPSS